MNIQILGAMLRQGCATRNFAYVIKIMDIVKTELIKPNEQFLRHLESFRKDCGVFKPNELVCRTAHFRKEVKNFQQELEKWKEFMGLNNTAVDEAVRIVRQHPWEQFTYDQPNGMEALKNPKLRHQKKLTRHIQRIKLDKLRGDEGQPSSSIDQGVDQRNIA